ncbi:MAG: KamA family radical SAM protein [Fibrobacter sp.]|nr:KamA family radical SAM protein [Fibrobacter sp.]
MNKVLKNFTQLQAFLDYIGTARTKTASLIDFSPSFPFFCSKHYADLIKKAKNPGALLRQILPSTEELKKVPGFIDDPVGDVQASQSNCIIQKYDGRALIVATGACGVRCRFCFRRNFQFKNEDNISIQVASWLDTHSDIWEIILSGGDPLILSNSKFKNLIEAIASHASVSTLRIHTRLPVMAPELVLKKYELLRELPSRFNCVLVSHVNHFEELDESSYAVFSLLQKSGWILLNQSVLLKGVNDDAKTLECLCRKLFEQGVLPYYLHQLDHANGVAHFEVSDEKAKELVESIRTKLPGYLVPTLVREIAGEKSKTPLR